MRPEREPSDTYGANLWRKEQYFLENINFFEENVNLLKKKDTKESEEIYLRKASQG
jgi:hypothetical protein